MKILDPPLCCDALWATADAAAGARPGAAATRWYKRVSRSRIGASWHLEKRCSGSQFIGECDGDKIKEGSWAQSYQDGDVAMSPPRPHFMSLRPHSEGQVHSDADGVQNWP